MRWRAAWAAIVVVAAVVCCAAAPAPAPPGRVTLVLGGDVIPHAPLKHAARAHARQVEGRSVNADGWGDVLGPLSDVLRRADVAVVNLETPVTAAARPETGPFLFHAPPPLLAALARAGVDGVSTANNHALDQRRDGLLETRAHAGAAGLWAVGTGPSREAAWAPHVVARGGLRVGFLALTRPLNGFTNPRRPDAPHVAWVPPREHGGVRAGPGAESVEGLLARVEAAARGCDALVVLVHWGGEYSPRPAAQEVALARALVARGAAAVVGHHPHVLQPVEWVEAGGRRGLVAYSLGNLVSNQAPGARLRPGHRDADRREGALLELALVRRPGAPRAEVEAVRAVPLWTEHVRGRGRARIQTLVLDAELAALDVRLAALAGRAGAAERAEARRLERRRAWVGARRARVLARLFGTPAAPAGARAVAASR